MIGQRGLRARQAELEAALAAQALTRRRDAAAAQEELLQRLLRAAGYRDDNTHEHTQRVADLAARLARELALPDRQVALVHRAAPLHDIGKIAIPDSILLKPGRLTDEEFEVVKTHAVLGARVLQGGDSDVIQTAEAIARHHHERWDGGGYPGGLAGDAIPLRGPARAPRRRLRRARPRASVQGLLDGRGGGRRDRARSGYGLRSGGRTSVPSIDRRVDAARF